VNVTASEMDVTLEQDEKRIVRYSLDIIQVPS
jgi:hypothetical protein